ncbi:hypothetical protein [Empedobacter sp. UBA5039]|nr:hypothetical protein [Empedobacter sp. UBA5039]
MSNLQVKDIIELLSDNIVSIPEYKKYWLIRTQSGNLFDLFVEHKMVGLEHSEINLSEITQICNDFNKKESLQKIKQLLVNYYESIDFENDITPQKIGLIAGQIYKFFKEVKIGDIVVIPSTNSEVVSFGEVTENHIAVLNTEEKRVFDFDFPLLKRVKWIKELRRTKLDPYFYKVFTSHQAITDISNYAEVIERSLNDLFILNDEAHNVIRIEAEVIKAKDLFGLGYELLDLIDDFCEYYSIDGVSSDDFEVTININSPGKIDFKSLSKKGIGVAAFVLLLTGGGLKYKELSLTVGGIPSLIDSYNTFLETRNKVITEQKMDSVKLSITQDIWNHYKDSLDIKEPKQMIELMKQVDKNQDLPK